MILAKSFARKAILQAGVLLLVLLSLAGCAFSPEQAIVRQVQDLDQGWEDQTVDLQTI